MTERAPASYRLGDRGPAVRAIRERLRDSGDLTDQPLDLPYDEHVTEAVRAFQQRRGLQVDGVVGPQTWVVLDGSHWHLGDRLLGHTPGHLVQGDDVVELQQRLSALGFGPTRVDGIFGAGTETAVRRFQQSMGLASTGTVGPDTLRTFRDLSRSVTGGAPQALRERELIRRAGHNLAGKTIVIDPGHGGPDRGAAAPGAGLMDEADAVLDIARRIEGRLSAVGVTVLFTRGNKANPTTAERAEIANEAGADVMLSLHCEAIEHRAASGVATYYYGTESRGAGSAVAENLAGLVLREIAARTGLTDCRSHARTWTILHRPVMPTVLVEAGYLTHPDDAKRLADPAFRDTVAEAVSVALQRVYTGEDDAAETGVLDLRELRAQLREQAAGPTAGGQPERPPEV